MEFLWNFFVFSWWSISVEESVFSEFFLTAEALTMEETSLDLPKNPVKHSRNLGTPARVHVTPGLSARGRAATPALLRGWATAYHATVLS